HQLARLRTARLAEAALGLALVFAAALGLAGALTLTFAGGANGSSTPRVARRRPRAGAAPRRRRRAAPRFDQRQRLYEGESAGVNPLRDRRVDLAVGHVGAVAYLE